MSIGRYYTKIERREWDQIQNPTKGVHLPRLERTAPIRLADRNHAHYPSRLCTILKKMAQWRTSSTHNLIHTGVIGRCCHVHLKHQIHGADWKTPFCSPKGKHYWLRHQIQCVNWTILYKDRKKGVRINSKSLERQVYAPRLEPTAPIRLADRNHAHYPSRHCTILKKKTAQWRTSSTHDSIHTGVIGDVATYTWSTKSMVLIEKLPFAPRRATNIGWDT